MAPLSAKLSRSLRAEPVASDSEPDSGGDESDSEDDVKSSSGSDENTEFSATDMSTAEDGDSDIDEPEDVMEYQLNAAKKRKRTSDYDSDKQTSSSSSSSKISGSKDPALPLTGLDSISFAALAAAQDSLAQGNTRPAAATYNPPPQRQRRRTSGPSRTTKTSITASSSSPLPRPPAEPTATDNKNSNSNNNLRRTHIIHPPSRSSKHAPAAMSSTRPVSRRRIVVSGSEPISNANANANANLNLSWTMNMSSFGPNSSGLPAPIANSYNINNNNNKPPLKFRDPRFTPLSGQAPSPATLQRRYAFLDEYRAAEAKALRQIINSNNNNDQTSKDTQRNPTENGKGKRRRRRKDTSVLEESHVAARAALQRHEALARNRERALAEQEVLRAHRRREREALRSGRKGSVWFLKRGAVKGAAVAAAVAGRDGLGTGGRDDAAATTTASHSDGMAVLGNGSASERTGRMKIDNEHGHGLGQVRNVSTVASLNDENSNSNNRKKEGKREKRLMKKEKWIMGQKRRRVGSTRD